ncbi:hypothetical protein HJC23_002657 [Cyclotella cryptica]|uniref:PROP1-like PPR domain-containing protein n=1 Tax=Cyclotella cryptica TaxID=29204 RepID=A0ABD3PLB1_9STRA
MNSSNDNTIPEGHAPISSSPPLAKSDPPQAKQEGATRPDHGQNYMPVKSEPIPDLAPRPLDHFKRGYVERTELRDRDMGSHTPTGVDRNAAAPAGPTAPPAAPTTYGYAQPAPALPDKKPNDLPAPQQLPPAAAAPSSYYGPASSPNMDNHNRKTYDDDKQYSRSNHYDHNYSKYDDKQYTRSYVDERHRDGRGSYGSNDHSRSSYRGSTGFSMEEVVDRLCHPRSKVSEEMDEARRSSPESFSSGRAITAILSQLGRRRQMNVAMQVWHWMERTEGIQRNVFHYNALINVCEKIKDWKRALELLRQMDEEGVAKNEITYSSAISACEKGGNWRTALDLLSTMKKNGIMPTVIAYNAAISACEKGLNPSKALEIFDEMKREGVRPTVVTFSALISACEKGQQWKLALQVLEEMKKTFGPNVIAYSAAISALSKGQQWEKAWELFCEIEASGENPGLQWQRALDLFDEMKYKNMNVTVVSYGSAISACEKGYQWKQCLEYLDEMTERNIPKNVIIFGAAMSCMEKSCRADIAFQLMERMAMEGVRPNVHIYNSAISACARCKLWKKGFELFKEMDDVGIKRDVVTYNAVLDAVYSQLDLAKQIFHEGVERGFYAKVSRLGTQWLELDLHFLSLGGGETALRWWFEECLVPYLGNSKELATVKSIDIVTGYGKTRSRGARKGDDGMRKRVRAMLSFMNLTEVEQPNLGRIHIDKEVLMREVERNGGRIIFDAHGYEQYKLREGLDDPYIDAKQVVRPRGGAMHARNERDRQEDPWGPGGGNGFTHDHQGPPDGRPRTDDMPYQNDRNHRSDSFHENGGFGRSGGGAYREEAHGGRQDYPNDYHGFQPQKDNRPPPQDRDFPTQTFNEHRPGSDDWKDRGPPPRRFENSDAEYNKSRDRPNWHESSGNSYRYDGNRNSGYGEPRQSFHSPRYNDRKRPYDGGSERYHDRGGPGEHAGYDRDLNSKRYQR